MLCAEGGEGEGDDVEVRGGVGRGAEGDALQTHEAVAGGRVRGGEARPGCVMDNLEWARY